MYSVEWEGHTIGWEIQVDKKFAYITSHADLYIDGKLVAKSPGGFRLTEKACSELEHNGKTVPVKLTVVSLFISFLIDIKVDGKLIKRMHILFWKIRFGILNAFLSLVLGTVIGCFIGYVIVYILFLLFAPGLLP